MQFLSRLILQSDRARSIVGGNEKEGLSSGDSRSHRVAGLFGFFSRVRSRTEASFQCARRPQFSLLINPFKQAWKSPPRIQPNLFYFYFLNVPVAKEMHVSTKGSKASWEIPFNESHVVKACANLAGSGFGISRSGFSPFCIRLDVKIGN